MVLLPFKSAKNVIGGISDSISGSASSAYTAIIDFPCLGILHKTVHLKNTDSVLSLKYRVLTYAHTTDDAIPYEEVAETVLAAGDVAQIVLNYAYARIIVEAMRVTDDCPYQLDYVGVP